MWVEWDEDLAAIGVIEPVFVDVVVGFATREVVHTEAPQARFVTEGSTVPDFIDWTYREIPPRPIIRQELRWRQTA